MAGNSFEWFMDLWFESVIQ